MNFTCPNCKKSASRRTFHNDCTYDVFMCPSDCLSLYFLKADNTLHYYRIVQSLGNYILVSSTLLKRTYLVRPTVSKEAIIVDFPHFFPIETQEEINGVIDRLLKLKAFS